MTMRGKQSSAKSTITLRIEANTLQLIDEAAAVLGKSRGEFIVDSAREQATNILEKQRL